MITRDLECPWHDCIICNYDVTGADFENLPYAFRQSEKRQRVQCIIKVIVSHRTAKKCTKSYTTLAQLLFCSLNLLFDGVFVAVAVGENAIKNNNVKWQNSSVLGSALVTEKQERQEFCLLILTLYQSRLSCDPQQVLQMKQPLT